jgi:pyridoxal phosphate enzyme (YggS family)
MENLQSIRENIRASAKISGRFEKDVTLIAVTKTIGHEEIAEILSLGVCDLGENKVQEFLTKYGVFTPEPAWHLIGHLQTNKVKYIIDKVKTIQSVDSLRLAEEINKRAKERERTVEILIEINIAGEDTKYGIKPDETATFLEHMYKYSNIRVIGLMCIAPFTEKPEKNKVFFEKMLKLSIDMREREGYNSLTDLSMGMTNDYAAAVECGATMVRIGTALFARPDKINGGQKSR